jgi:type IV pilus assembly protein PilK
MTADPGPRDPSEAETLAALARALDERLGILLPQGGPEALTVRLRHRIRERAFGGLAPYAEYLVHGAPEAAWTDLAETLTRNESRVFEAPQDFLPLFELTSEARWARYARGGGDERFRALSAGCGTGEEAYSVAVALSETAVRIPAFRFEVLGVDLSRRAIGTARRGIYPASRFEALPPELVERHLTPASEGRLAVHGPKRETRFALANLSREDALASLGAFDLILARGVLPGLTPRARPIAVANLSGALKPGGVLLLGPGEVLGDADADLVPVRWGDRHAYERPGPWAPAGLPEEDRVPEPGTALVAHRSPLVRQWLSLLLLREGYAVETAANGIEALTRGITGRARALHWLERTLPPLGGEPVAERLIAVGAAQPDRVLLLSPRPEGAASESESALPVAPIPLARDPSWIPAPGAPA